ncbi:prepilin-type N-terminal cleavage/methylation domain-containing protein [Azonexus sp.]|uniref:prepilin-type N-terminal cleavage/methylation domain-containing protein n=1 Tax=Azonexus sp. TaxID=1872668 RepID=UPI0027B8DEC3|nr:prepilin-type N-terminal cleavage/methylation domain-containing protein [Azonexus sp.]
MPAKQHGFTLVEIAIVLVIIGILLGGILKGQEMITQGKIRSVEKEMDSISIALLSYQDRYKALPGDDDKAKSRWTNTENGNFSGTIDEAFNSVNDAHETRRLWNHLRRAGFINGDSESFSQPGNAVGGLVGVQTDIRNGTSIVVSGVVICSTNLPAKVANAVDAQQDDGNPARGSLRGFSQSASNTPDFATTISAYVDDGNKLYTLCKTT